MRTCSMHQVVPCSRHGPGGGVEERGSGGRISVASALHRRSTGHCVQKPRCWGQAGEGEKSPLAELKWHSRRGEEGGGDDGFTPIWPCTSRRKAPAARSQALLCRAEMGSASQGRAQPLKCGLGLVLAVADRGLVCITRGRPAGR